MLVFHTLDVFTDRPYAGNPLAVVLGADRLDDGQMQLIAREFNLSETVFVMAPRDPSHTARVRIFLPRGEIPFAGHPTLGCAALLAELAQGAGDWDADVVLEEVAGLVPVTLNRRKGITGGRFAAPVIPEHARDAPPVALIARALGLMPSQIGRAAYRPGIYRGGPSFLIVPLADRAALAAAAPGGDWPALEQAAGTGMVYLHAPGDRTDLEARMFSPSSGVPEDPATGSATAILAAHLHEAGALVAGETTLTIRQGAAMGRPSLLALTVTIGAGRIGRVEVGGAAVRVAEGRIALPR